MSAEIRSIDTGKTDQQIADEYRRRLTEALQPVLAIMSEANRIGIRANFSVGADQTGRTFIASMEIVKPL